MEEIVIINSTSTIPNKECMKNKHSLHFEIILRITYFSNEKKTLPLTGMNNFVHSCLILYRITLSYLQQWYAEKIYSSRRAKRGTKT